MAARLEFGLLGPLRVVAEGTPIPVRSARQRVLLASLLLRAGHIVPFHELIERLWGEEPSDASRTTLRSYVMRLRKTLDAPGLIRTTDTGYRLDVEPASLDVQRFAEAMDAIGPGERTTLHEALRLWRGEPLVDVPSDSLRRDFLPGLEDRRSQAIVRRVELDLRDGVAPGELIGELRELTTAHPYRERLWVLLITALSMDGRQAEALAVHGRVRELLATDLGIDPGPELNAVQRAVLGGEIPGVIETSAQEQVRDRSGGTADPAEKPMRPNELPAPLPDFVGRADVVERLAKELSEGGERGRTERDVEVAAPSVAVLSGSPGIGKTATAVRVAHAVRDRFPDGQLYIDLAAYSLGPPLEPTQVLTRFLRSLGVAAERIPLDADEQSSMYRSLLGGQRVLVVLDNAASAAQVRPLLPGGPGCAVLVTSRNELRGLRLQGASQEALDVLGENEAVRLLDPDGEWDDESTTRDLVRLCARIPLALRIAAANVAGLGDLHGYVEMLRRHRLEALSVDDEDSERAVRGTFDLSYSALKPLERGMFRSLGLIPGRDFTAATAAALIGVREHEAARLLDRLAIRNLVHRHAAGRYRFHDLLRDYAVERIELESGEGERGQASRSLLLYYLATIDAAGDRLAAQFLRLPRPPVPAASFESTAAATEWLDAERGNIVAAIRAAAADGPAEFAWLLADALRPYLWLGGFAPDAIRASEYGLRAARSAGDVPAEAAMLHSLGTAWWGAGGFPHSIDYLERSLRCAREAGLVERERGVLNNLAGCHAYGGRVDRSVELFGEGLKLCDGPEGEGMRTVLLSNLSAAQDQLDVRAAHRTLTEALRLAKATADKFRESLVLINFVGPDIRLGLLDDAESHAEQALRMVREAADRPRESVLLTDLGWVQLYRGDTAAARRLGVDGLALAENVSMCTFQINALVLLGTVALERADPEHAHAVFSAVVDRSRSAGYIVGDIEGLTGLATASVALGDAAAGADYAIRAVRMSIRGTRRVLEAFARIALADARLQLGERAEALRQTGLGLDILHETGATLGGDRFQRVLVEFDRG